jgi:7-cyano-7-deazaguanine reductase
VTANQAPSADQLETFPNPRPGRDFRIEIVCPEFTSLCPVTGQPDFGTLVLDYAPADWIVESKSLKLFLQSFRNYGAFHEDCTLQVAKRVVEAISPQWLRIGGYWNPRGGMPIDVFWQTGAPPEGLWLPDQGVATYRSRG